MVVRPFTRSKALGSASVSGRIRRPAPAASTKPITSIDFPGLDQDHGAAAVILRAPETADYSFGSILTSIDLGNREL
jgi:hypothetical protein